MAPSAKGKQPAFDDHEDDDDHSSLHDGGDPSDTKGGKANSTQVRKAQNRIAQREFRLRKQQYIRDLEARVEVLSGDKEERIELTMLLVKNLLKENKELRGMIKQMAGFIGEGLGSCLPRLGLSAPQLDALLHRADTDTAYEAFVNLRASRELQEANPGLPLGEIRRKSSAAGKRKRGSTAAGEHPEASAEPQSTTQTPDREASGNKIARHNFPENPATLGQYAEAENYGYLFPNLDQMPNWGSRFQEQSSSSGPDASSGPGGPGPYAASPLSSVRDPQGGSYLPQYNLGPDQQPIRGMFPIGGGGGGPGGGYPPQQIGLWNQFGTMLGSDLSGFGLTLPPQPGGFQPGMSSGMYAGPGGDSEELERQLQAQSLRQAQGQPQVQMQGSGQGQAQPSSAAASKSTSMDSKPPSSSQSKRDQEKLRMAVTMFIQSKGVTDGPAMTAEEVEERMRVQRGVLDSLKEDESFMKRIEPMQLIAYHLNNFRVNHAYVLPASLRPTPVQRTIPHEHAIDGIPFPSIRDRMILLRGRYDLVEAYQGFLLECNVRGDDPLDHRNWEMSEKWLRDFPILADDEAYAVANRWRAERGEPPLTRLVEGRS